MTGDSRLTTTFGILLSGLLSAEEEASRATARATRRPPLRARSGTYLMDPARWASPPEAVAPRPGPGHRFPSVTR